MRKLNIMIIIVCIIISTVGCGNIPQEEIDEFVFFDDEVFQFMFDRTIYKEYSGRGEGINPTESQIKRMTSLRLHFEDDESCSLKDLDKFPNLRGISIRNAPSEVVNEISQLQYLKALRIIDEDTAADVSPIGNLKNVEALTIRGNSYADSKQDWSFIKEMKQLESLDIEHIKLEDLSFIEELPNLEILVIDDALIGDISALKTLKSLKYLDLYGDEKHDYAAVLKHLPQLEQLAIGKVEISDLSFLQDMKNLTWLSIRGVGTKTLPEWLTAENYPQLGVLEVDQDMQMANSDLIDRIKPVLEEREKEAPTEQKLQDPRNDYPNTLELMSPVESYDQEEETGDEEVIH